MHIIANYASGNQIIYDSNGIVRGYTQYGQILSRICDDIVINLVQRTWLIISTAMISVAHQK